MRPIERGDWPTGVDGMRLDFSTEYKNARGALIERVGEYCSYCEARIQSGLAVEHVLPKRPEGSTEDIPERFGDWDNFLLACTNCNSYKSKKEIPCLTPDKNNTFFALEYGEGGTVFPRAGLTGEEKELAQNLIDLVGLNRRPPSPDLKATDRRWLNRFDAWRMAKHHRERLLATNCDEEMQKAAIMQAKADGHWSVWMTVCKDLQSFCARLVEEFPGTAKRYFDNGAVREVV